MSQRDQFAIRAMEAIISNTRTNPYGDGVKNHYDDIAWEAYRYADAMLQERERTNKSKAQQELEK